MPAALPEEATCHRSGQGVAGLARPRRGRRHEFPRLHLRPAFVCCSSTPRCIPGPWCVRVHIHVAEVEALLRGKRLEWKLHFDLSAEALGRLSRPQKPRHTACGACCAPGRAYPCGAGCCEPLRACSRRVLSSCACGCARRCSSFTTRNGHPMLDVGVLGGV